MLNVQYYTIIEKNHQCNWSFGHQSQHPKTIGVYDDNTRMFEDCTKEV
jgi:hypothetical protein